MALTAPEILTADHDVSQFTCGKPVTCGKPALDHWLKTRALANQQKGFTVVLVVHDAGRVVGYYGVAPTSIVPTVLPRSIKSGQPPNPVPCLLLGQLATDIGWMGRGVGTGLLRHALIRCIRAAELIGGRALVVRAIDPDAAAFWGRRGFLPSKDDPLTLFRSIADIAASLQAAERRPASHGEALSSPGHHTSITSPS